MLKNVQTSDINEVCRLCLIKGQTLQPIFDISKNRPSDMNIVDKITLCLPVHITKNDPISKKLCLACILKVEEFYEFWNNAAFSQVFLENLANTSGISDPNGNNQQVDNVPLDPPSCSSQDNEADSQKESLDPDSPQPCSTSQNCGDVQNAVNPLDTLHQNLANTLPTSQHLNGTIINDENEEKDSTNQILALNYLTNDTVAQNKKEEVICHYCLKKCSNRYRLGIHIRTHTGERPYKCSEPNCFKAFSSNYNLRIHQRNRHLNDRPFKCERCDKSYITAAKLKFHNKKHLDSEYNCSYCNYTIFDEDLLERHIRRKHTNDYLCVCDICGKGFFSRIRFREHKAVHDGVLPFNCDFCEKKFQKYSQLQYHRTKYHTNQNNGPLPCNECGKLFYNKKTLSQHYYRIHQGLRYECYECGRCVTSKESMITHLRRHLGVKLYKCNICSKRFISSNGLKLHNVVHTKEKKFICKICNKAYSQRSTLTTHNKKVHAGVDDSIDIVKEEIIKCEPEIPHLAVDETY